MKTEPTPLAAAIRSSLPVATHTELRVQATELRLHGLLAHWDELIGQPQTEQHVRQWLAWENAERAHRSLERRLRDAHLGRFKPLADFDWSWPTECDRAAIEELMSLQFLTDASSVVLFGPNGVGKTMVAANLGHQAVLQGHTALFTTAGQMLSELAALDSDSALRRRLQHYAAPDLLLIDEVGYMSYSNRHADMLFELISRRYLHKSTVVTTNRRFADWGEVFPNAACVVSLVDRLMHRAEVVRIDGQSYRQKESQERLQQRTAQRSPKDTTQDTTQDRPVRQRKARA
jgi:DNA replication protein DnaC